MTGLAYVIWTIYVSLVITVAKLAWRDWKKSADAVDVKATVVTALLFAAGFVVLGVGLTYWPGLP